jgi:hypothetical protein
LRGWGEGGCGRLRDAMSVTQTLYAHMNKIKIKKKRPNQYKDGNADEDKMIVMIAF